MIYMPRYKHAKIICWIVRDNKRWGIVKSRRVLRLSNHSGRKVMDGASEGVRF